MLVLGAAYFFLAHAEMMADFMQKCTADLVPDTLWIMSRQRNNRTCENNNFVGKYSVIVPALRTGHPDVETEKGRSDGYVSCPKVCWSGPLLGEDVYVFQF